MKVNTLNKNWKNVIEGSVNIAKALITMLAFSMNFAMVESDTAEQIFLRTESFIPKLSKVLLSMNEFSLQSIVFLVLLFKFYQFCDSNKTSTRTKIACAGMAVFASVCFVIGEAFYVCGNIDILVKGLMQLIKLVIAVVGYLIFFYELFILAVQQYDKCLYNEEKKTNSFFEKKYAFWGIVGILIVAWSPILFSYYPAMFMGDSEDIIYMAYNYPTPLIGTVQLRVEGVNITNHHPVIFTVIVGAVLKLVKTLGGSDNLGIFVYALIQYMISALVLAYTCVYLGRNLKKERLAVCAVLFYIFCPWIPKYVIMISKDTIFSECILLLGIQLHKAVKGQCEEKQLFIISLLAVAILLFRKNGFYVVLLTFVLLLILYRKQWKKWLICLAMLLVCNTLYSDVVLPMAGITDGSVREALSIPFQQTARYVRDHADEVTEEEMLAIDAVLQYDSLGELYDGNISDPVKATFRIHSDSEDLKNYLVVWFKMLWKHPETYIAATLNNYYGYVYPVVNDVHKLYRTSVGSMNNTNRDGYFNFSNSYDGVRTWLRDILGFFDLLWMRIPVMNLLTISAFYVWAVIAGGFLKLVRGDKTGFVIMFMYFALILTAIAGPCNAIDYERYISPCIFAFPIILGIILQEDRLAEDKENGTNLSIGTDTVL